jgi:DNA-binding transcriptional ArsR family regulator
VNKPFPLVFAALGDPTRLAMVEQLARESAPATALSGPIDLSQQACSKHVRILVEAGLVRQEKRGRQRVCILERERLEEAMAWMQAQLTGPEPDWVVTAFDPAMD